MPSYHWWNMPSLDEQMLLGFRDELKKMSAKNTDTPIPERIAYGLMGAGALAVTPLMAAPAIDRLTGVQTLYHGTSPEVASRIRSVGLDPSFGGTREAAAMGPNHPHQARFREGAKGHAFVTELPHKAKAYARAAAGDAGEVLHGAMPYEDFARDFVPDMDDNPLFSHKTNKVVTPSTFSVRRADVLKNYAHNPSRYINYVRNHPGRVAAGVALASLPVLGAAGLYKAFHSSHEPSSSTEKMALALPSMVSLRQGASSAGQLLSSGAKSVGGAIQRGAGAAGTGAALGGAAGGIVGAGAGAYKGYQQAKEEGASTGQAIGHGILGGFKGVTPGAMIGAGVGGAAGAATHAINPEMAAKLVDRARNTAGIGGIAQYGQAQAHAATGWRPSSGKLSDLGIGAAPVGQRAMAAREHAKALAEGRAGDPTRVFGHIRRGLLGKERDLAVQKYFANADASRLSAAYSQAAKNEKAGLTNLPGYVDALRQDPTGTLAAAFKQRWHEQGTLGKAMMLSMPAMGAAHMMRQDDPNKGTGERMLGAGGTLLGSFAFSPMTGTADMLLGGGLGKVTGALGRGVDRAAGFKPGRPPGTDIEDHTIGPPVERYESDRFRGQAPEGGAE